ncbi:MAG TPA: polyprenyl synthetase family protein, partial [Thermomicrobiales bacterium]|nr:polyprenyl synthetase family protein [Thermomicrobiales bacterium]
MPGTPTTMRHDRPAALTEDRLDALIEPYLGDAVAALDGAAPLLAGMARYHLGAAAADLTPLPPGAVDRGKRIRPEVALLAAGAAGGDPAAAAPLGAAIELLHNFTLIHDDVQDESPTRRHRPTVWSVWGVGQAINAGDALFAAAHLPLYRLIDAGAAPPLALRLLEGFDRMTIAIVVGQTLDLGFEGRADVAPADYLDMIDGKTAAIVRFAAWAGALLGGADEAAAERFAAFGRALGLGFQVQDDLLGVWGEPAQTGKAPADDIRRRKQSLPILL